VYFFIYNILLYYSFGITASIAAKVASFPAGSIIVILSPISHLKWVTAAVRRWYVFPSATT